jgi:DNA invertase Pin-like site-specific DNA recombinase
MMIGYARVSSDDQNPDLQHDALTAAGCSAIYEDRITGTIFTRAEFDRALAALKPGDEFVVWKVDRVGRGMMDTLRIVLELDARGIRFRSLTQDFLDTKTAMGRGVLAPVAAIAEDEVERLRKRTRAGMQAAKRRGQHVGRPRKLTPHQLAHARQLIAPDMWTGWGIRTLSTKNAA